MIREVVEAGIKNYQTTLTKGVMAFLAKWAEEHNVTGPKDLSEHLDKYLWEGADE